MQREQAKKLSLAWKENFKMILSIICEISDCMSTWACILFIKENT